MSKHHGDLWVITCTGQTGWAGSADPTRAPSPAQLGVMRGHAAGNALLEVAALPNARWPAQV